MDRDQGALTMDRVHMAIDLGANSGRVMVGRANAAGLSLKEAARFAHEVRERDGRLRWDIDAIRGGIHDGLRRACEEIGDASVASVSCDSWAQDFGLLDREGRLAYAPCSYRDPRTEGLPARFADRLSQNALHRRNGSAISGITTLCQLKAMAEGERAALADRPRLLHIADLVHYLLCGRTATDWTMATASQCWHIEADDWDVELMERLDIPPITWPPVFRCPGVLGPVLPESAPHPKLTGVPVVVTAGHDTTTATAIVHPANPGDLFLSLGTWCMLGGMIEGNLQPSHFTSDRTVTYLGLPFGRWGIFRGGAGLWPIQQCRREWEQSGQVHPWGELERAARESRYPGLVDLSHEALFAPPRMRDALRARCRAEGQPEPETPGDYTRLVFRSLAQQIARMITTLSGVLGQDVRGLYAVGGGTRHPWLCRQISDATRLPLHRGPVEATSAGNILLQALALNMIEKDPHHLNGISAALFSRDPIAAVAASGHPVPPPPAPKETTR